SPETETRTRTGIGFVGTTAEIAMKRVQVGASPGATAPVGDVRLTIRSSKSALSDNPLGPSASIGIAWAMGTTHDHSVSVTTTSNRPATDWQHTPDAMSSPCLNR